MVQYIQTGVISVPRLGANSIDANIGENFSDYIQLYPTPNTALFTSVEDTGDDDDKMVIISNLFALYRC